MLHLKVRYTIIILFTIINWWSIYLYAITIYLFSHSQYDIQLCVSGAFSVHRVGYHFLLSLSSSIPASVMSIYRQQSFANRPLWSVPAASRLPSSLVGSHSAPAALSLSRQETTIFWFRLHLLTPAQIATRRPASLHYTFHWLRWSSTWRPSSPVHISSATALVHHLETEQPGVSHLFITSATTIRNPAN